MEDPQILNTNERQEDVLDTITYDELLVIAKEKTKQAKTLATKNSRLQTKYVEVFKESKLLKKDQVCFTDFIKLIFEDQQIKVTGSWELTDISNKWIKREQQIKNKIERLQHEVEQKGKLIQKLEIQKQTIKPDEKVLLQVRNLQNQIKFQITNTNNLVSQKNNLQDALSKKQQELQMLNDQKISVQKQLNRVKVNQAQRELEQTMSVFSNKRQNEAQRTQILQIRQQLDQSLQKNDELNDNITRLKNKLQNKNKQIQILRQKNQIYEKQQQSLNVSLAESQIQIPLSKNGSQTEQGQPLQKQYLKNIFIRFMKSLNESNYLQAKTLESVLMTILEFNKIQRQQAVIRQKTWWDIFQ